jgi:hypothetical protein
VTVVPGLAAQVVLPSGPAGVVVTALNLDLVPTASSAPGAISSGASLHHLQVADPAFGHVYELALDGSTAAGSNVQSGRYALYATQDFTVDGTCVSGHSDTGETFETRTELAEVQEP